MTNQIVLLAATAAVLLFVLINETARKLAALAIVVALAFAVGWFWPKPTTAVQMMDATTPRPCVSSF